MSKVSILLSVYNGERFVRDAVLSILAQTYREFELLIVDDASTDGTHTILEELAAQDPRIRILTNSTNLGLTKSLNIALAAVGTGDPSSAFGLLRMTEKVWPPQNGIRYIARMDADDIALPDRLEKQLAFLQSHPDIDVVGTAYEWIDEDGAVIGRPHVITDPDDIHRVLPRTNPLLHSSVVMRRSALERVHGYDESFRRAQDYDLWLRLSRTSRMANLPDVLMQKRLARSMISFASERAQLRCAVRARYNAIRRGDIPAWSILYILKPLIASLLPQRFVQWIRVHIFNQRHYAHPTLR